MWHAFLFAYVVQRRAFGTLQRHELLGCAACGHVVVYAELRAIPDLPIDMFPE